MCMLGCSLFSFMQQTSVGALLPEGNLVPRGGEPGRHPISAVSLCLSHCVCVRMCACI